MNFHGAFAETIFTNNRTYKLVERIGNFAIFEAPNFGSIMYEVIRIRKEKAKTFPSGISVSAREVYPSPRDWGISGWTFTSRSHSNPLKAKLAELAS